MKSISFSLMKPFLYTGILLGPVFLAGCATDSHGTLPTPPAHHSDISYKKDTTPSPFPTSEVAALPDLSPAIFQTQVPSVAPTATPMPVPTPTGTPGEICFSESGYFFSENTWVELSVASPKTAILPIP